ncbi:hypothetical protein ACIPEN_06485 [Herbaspirillum chlorophenolicum]|uniref:Uncharacterized protein n=1 Tax=Herbaspirillum chlorophenolicum TaxID=211589 RepID=A0ABW8EY16_9BURK
MAYELAEYTYEAIDLAAPQWFNPHQRFSRRQAKVNETASFR